MTPVRTFGQFLESEGILKLLRDTSAQVAGKQRAHVQESSKIGTLPISCDSCTAPKACCTATTFAFLWEGVPIANRLREDGRDTPEMRELLRQRAEAMETVSRDDYNAPCAFLSGDERCTVYTERPQECSGHYVSTPPAQCGDPAATEIRKFDVTFVSVNMFRIGEAFRSQLSLRRKVGREYYGALPRMVLLCLEAWERTDFRDFLRSQKYPDMMALAVESMEMLVKHNPDGFGDE